MVSLEEVLAAREAAAGRLHRTPLFRSRTLGEHTGANVHLKAELFQKTGSFKPRGVLANLAALTPEQRERGVIGISAGNHAQALAWGAAAEGIDALLVMWQGASTAKIEATRGYGAEVDLEAGDPTEAFERLAELQERTGRELVEQIVLVSEDELKDAMRLLYARAKLAVEPAGAAAVAALMAGKIPLEPRETAVAVVSGGNVATETTVAILAGG